MKHTSPATHSRPRPLGRRLAAPLRALVGAAVVAVVAFAPGVARAETSCVHDSDCVKAFICETSSVEACPNIACAPGDECDLPACTPSTTSECVPGPCTTDNDCAAGMVCFAQTDTESCSTPAQPPCAKGTNCAVAAVDAGSTCTSTTVKECVPRYVPPCTADADCGAGFTCVADQECGCSGSAGSGSTSASPPGTVVAPDDPAPAVDAGDTPPNCSCTTLPTSHCQANVIPCSVSGDCPSQWSCAPSPSAVSGCAVGVSVDGSTTTSVCNMVTPPAQNVCEPPYSDLDLGGDLASGELNGSSGSSGSTSATDNSGTAPTAGSPASAAAADGSGQGGCAVASGPSKAGAGGWLALVGLAAFLRRRRGGARQGAARRSRTA